MDDTDYTFVILVGASYLSMVLIDTGANLLAKFKAKRMLNGKNPYHSTSKNPELTQPQKAAAKVLLSKRPMCYPGTANIIEKDRAKDWYAAVANAAVELKITPAQEAAFFDACGVDK